MYTFTVAVDIAAAPARVWRALCHPAEVVQWDSGVRAALDAPPDYPRPGQHVRWRCRTGWWWRLLHDWPVEVVPERTLRAELRRGPYRIDETYTIEPGDGGCRLAAAIRFRVAIPVVGPLIERAGAGRRTKAGVAASLAALARHCAAP